MQRSRLVTERVLDIDDDLVADVGGDLWDGPLSVDANGGTIKGTVWIGRDPANIEVVRDGGGVCAGKEGCEERQAQQMRGCYESHLCVKYQFQRQQNIQKKDQKCRDHFFSKAKEYITEKI